jgi:glutamate-5-semialdehyde dehydrogenase
MAHEVCFDSKVQYPAVCNAVDCILIHRDTAEAFLPIIVDRMSKRGVQLRGDKKVRKMVPEGVEPFNEDDIGKEYLDYILALKIVNNLEEAIDYINKHGSHHTDAILTENPENARKFLKLVDSASVFWNASTRFSDGYRYGLGAEVGISTGKIHARGPTGLEGLLSYKYYLKGNGQILGDYVGNNKREFKHMKTSKKW